MEVDLTKTVKAIEKLVANNQHEYFAKKSLQMAMSNVVLLVKSYAVMKVKQPLKYQHDIVTGTMLDNFKKAMSYEMKVSTEIFLIANHRRVLDTMAKAVAYRNAKQKLDTGDSETTALAILVDIWANTDKVSEFKAAANIKRDSLVANEPCTLEEIEKSLSTKLTENYLQ